MTMTYVTKNTMNLLLFMRSIENALLSPRWTGKSKRVEDATQVSIIVSSSWIFGPVSGFSFSPWKWPRK